MTAERAGRRPPTAQEFVLDELRRGIASGELRPGEPIRQDALAERLGVSRVPLREALKILEGEGQVVYRPHRGYFVAELSLADLLEVYRIRELLEAEAARQAVKLATAEDIERLTAAQRDVERAGAAGDVLAMTEANRRFHFTLLEASGMPRLVRLVRLLWDATDAYRSIYYGDQRNRRRVDREHRAIVRAVQARDPERLVTLLDRHRSHAVLALSRIIGDRDRQRP